MSFFKDQTEAFIVRVWIERREIPVASAEWRGVIEHVTSSQRRYFKDLTTIISFIQQYGVEMQIGTTNASKVNIGRKDPGAVK